MPRAAPWQAAGPGGGQTCARRQLRQQPTCAAVGGVGGGGARLAVAKALAYAQLRDLLLLHRRVGQLGGGRVAIPAEQGGGLGAGGGCMWVEGWAGDAVKHEPAMVPGQGNLHTMF